jgi:hypothetical protein
VAKTDTALSESAVTGSQSEVPIVRERQFRLCVSGPMKDTVDERSAVTDLTTYQQEQQNTLKPHTAIFLT